MIVAVFDSGVDYTHSVFTDGPEVSFERASGLPRLQFLNLFHAAVAGDITAELLDFFADHVPADSDLSTTSRLLSGRDFAGHHPTLDFGEHGVQTTNIFDYNGHGTTSAGTLVHNGHTVLPIKVGYSLAPEISPRGLVAGCEWLINEKLRGLDCTHAVWTFGSPADPEDRLFEELVAELSYYDITVYASGRGVYQNIVHPGQKQHPSDLCNVIAVDEHLHLTRYQLAWDGLCFHGYHLPATPRPVGIADESFLVQAQTVSEYAGRSVVAVCTDADLRTVLPAVNGHARLLVVHHPDWPYIANPEPYLFDLPVIVTNDSTMLDLARKIRRTHISCGSRRPPNGSGRLPSVRVATAFSAGPE
jgi:hypothetical protein